MHFNSFRDYFRVLCWPSLYLVQQMKQQQHVIQMTVPMRSTIWKGPHANVTESSGRESQNQTLRAAGWAPLTDKELN